VARCCPTSVPLRDPVSEKNRSNTRDQSSKTPAFGRTGTWQVTGGRWRIRTSGLFLVKQGIGQLEAPGHGHASGGHRSMQGLPILSRPNKGKRVSPVGQLLVNAARRGPASDIRRPE
jgi:hypothetical protein